MSTFPIRTTVSAFVLAISILSANPAQAATVTGNVGAFSFQANDTNVAAGATVLGYTPGSLTPVVPSTVTLDGVTYDVKTIGNGAFRYSAITGITLPETLETISELAFDNANLVTVTIPDSVTYIGEQSFSNQSHMTSITFGSGLETIKYAAFANVANLGPVTIPANVSLIEQYAFGYSPRITSVTFNGSVATIATQAFFSNENHLSNVTFYGAPPGFMGAQALGNGVDLVTFPINYLDANYASGFTYPTWNGFNTQSVAMVMFDSNGGSAMNPPGVTSALGDTIARPVDPTRDGFEFAGWYTSSNGGSEWNFDTDTVTNRGTLFAHWNTPGADDGNSNGELASTGFETQGWLVTGMLALVFGFALLTMARRARHTFR
jgi:uncharacterized repeat protein (TIGR02543 family)